jgi:hypothetical protein
VNGRIQAILLGVLALVPLPAAADDITDAVQTALGHYQRGQLSAAAEELDFAAGLVRQKKAEVMRTLLPKPLPGWEVDEGSSSLMGVASYGGGVSVQRVFRQDQKMVLVSYVTDSLLLQNALMMFSDPSFATANGGRFDKIGGQKALVKYDGKDQSGEIVFVVNKRILVSIRGSQVPQNDLYAYANPVDFAALSRVP